MTKEVKNERWSVKTLIDNINSGKIIKPKYQRKKKWQINEVKEGRPNEESYINFLYKTFNSVHPITFGQEIKDGKQIYSNIDGNNRINAIKHFIDTPFEIFSKYFDELFTIIDNTELDDDIKLKIKSIFKKMSYNDIISIKYPTDFFEENNYFSKEICGKIENYDRKINSKLDNLQKKLLLNNKSPFDTTVNINVNIFEGYSTDELCKTFEDINKYNTKLTEDELLASRLYNSNDFEINDNIIKEHITNSLVKIYEERSEQEVLECYKYDNDNINAYDFINGLQYYCHNEYRCIETPNNNGLSLFFKLYQNIYENLNNTFTTENVNDFIEMIIYSCNILNKIYINIFTEQINTKLFANSCNKKLETLKKNNIYLVLLSIIGFYKKGEEEAIIINNIEKCLLYHLFISDLTNKETKEDFKNSDLLTYRAFGGAVDKSGVKLIKNPEEISNSISNEQFSDLIKKLMDDNNKPHKRLLDNGNIQLEKRRPRKFFEKTLMFYYYKSKVPVELLNNIFSLEHIIPNSSIWDDELDKDRLGNLIPIYDTINKSRSNKHIKAYKDTEGLLKFLNIIPDNETYNNIINHDAPKPKIINNIEYNNMCEKNELIYLDNFIKYLY